MIKLMTIFTMTTMNKGGNKQKFNKINWFAIRAKGGGRHTLICNIQRLSFIHWPPFNGDEYDEYDVNNMM